MNIDQNKIINSRSLTFLKEFCDHQFPDFHTMGKEDKRSKTITYEVKSEIKRTEVNHVEITEEQFQKLPEKSKTSKDGKFYHLKENVIWGYDTDVYANDLIQACIHAKLCASKVPSDASCRFYIGKYMRKSTTKIPPPNNDVVLRSIFNFNFDEIYTLDPKYIEDGKERDSGLSKREVLVKKDMMEFLGPYTLAKYSIRVSSNTTQTKQANVLRGSGTVKLRPSKYERITLVVDFWYPDHMMERLDEIVSKFLDSDNKEMGKVLSGFGVKTNHSINKKITKEQAKLSQQTKKITEDRTDKQFNNMMQQINKTDDFF